MLAIYQNQYCFLKKILYFQYQPVDEHFYPELKSESASIVQDIDRFIDSIGDFSPLSPFSPGASQTLIRAQTLANILLHQIHEVVRKITLETNFDLEQTHLQQLLSSLERFHILS